MDSGPGFVIAKSEAGYADYLGRDDEVVGEGPGFVILQAGDAYGAEYLLGRLMSGLRAFCPEGPFGSEEAALAHVERFWPDKAAGYKPIVAELEAGTYHVEWSVDVRATSPLEAAKAALAIARRQVSGEDRSWAFDVYGDSYQRVEPVGACPCGVEYLPGADLCETCYGRDEQAGKTCEQCERPLGDAEVCEWCNRREMGCPTCGGVKLVADIGKTYESLACAECGFATTWGLA